MLTLFCVVVGEGVPFSVKIDAEKTVSELKTLIKKENENTITCDADLLDLYLAKMGDAWLNTADAINVTLDEDGKLSSFDVKDPTFSITNRKHFGANFERKEGDIHVLVVIAAQGAVNAGLNTFTRTSQLEFQDAVLRGIRGIRNKVAVLEDRLPHKSEKSLTDGALGQTVIAKLETDELIKDFAPAHGEEAFWSPLIQKQANTIESEVEFDAFITPFFDLTLVVWCL
ncbi:Aste57867_14130 [Aphanomyces stellatus]|uniref:Aste57867_14130 protein n=1 Tax=Aphanomyces stellatus TaxID=120398 RepID=A0A485L0S3_9STRA|nr:hypothetical protein As57867_014079 [Aphanomyces stellatus]VFT90957.1 Aste57867_14130 [Aphanomyces stellatus]